MPVRSLPAAALVLALLALAGCASPATTAPEQAAQAEPTNAAACEEISAISAEVKREEGQHLNAYGNPANDEWTAEIDKRVDMAGLEATGDVKQRIQAMSTELTAFASNWYSGFDYDYSEHLKAIANACEADGHPVQMTFPPGRG